MAGNDSAITEMTAASQRLASAQYAAENKQAQLRNMTFHAFAGEPATHSSKCQLIIVNRIISQHRKDIVRNMVSDFKPTSVLKNKIGWQGSFLMLYWMLYIHDV